jgi:hypothetical protein
MVERYSCGKPGKQPVSVATDAPRTPPESLLKSPSDQSPKLATTNFGDGRSLNYFLQIVFCVMFNRVASSQVPPFTKGERGKSRRDLRGETYAHGVVPLSMPRNIAGAPWHAVLPAHRAKACARKIFAATTLRVQEVVCRPPLPGKFITNLRCFSNGCLSSTFVKRSAGFDLIGMWLTATRPFPRGARSS